MRDTTGLINTFGVSALKNLNNIAVWWNALGTIAVIITVLVTAPTRQSGEFVFRTFIDGTGVDGIGWSERASPAYVVVIGVLFAQYSLTGTSRMVSLALSRELTVSIGFDASAHVISLLMRANWT